MAGLVTVEQEFIKPRKYRVGGVEEDFSADVLAAYASDTNRAIESGFEIPVLNKHTRLGASDEEHAEAATGTDGKGWLRSVYQTPSGSLVHRLEVTPDVKQGIEAGTIKFTSPYFWPGYTTSDGKKLGNIIRHVAITPTPRTQDQGPFQFAEGQQLGWQFSMEDAVPEVSKPAEKKILTLAVLKELGCYVPADIEASLTDAEFDACLKVLGIVNDIRKATEKKAADMATQAPRAFAEEGEEEGTKPFPPKKEGEASGEPNKSGEGEGGEAKPGESDPAGSEPSDNGLASLLSQIVTELGVVLPEGIDAKSDAGMAIVLTAVINSVKGGKAADAGKPGQPGGIPKVEEANMAQFSETEKALAARIEKLEAERREHKAAQGRAALKANLKGLPKGLATRLDSLAGSVQFSDDGKEEPRLSISDVAKIVRESLPASLFGEEPKEVEHPGGAQFTEGDPNALSPEQVKALAAFAGGGPPPKA